MAMENVWNDLLRTPEGRDMWMSCGEMGSQFSEYVAGFYWTIATMMAVGYGDISPTTPQERLFAIATQVPLFLTLPRTQTTDGLECHKIGRVNHLVH